LPAVPWTRVKLAALLACAGVVYFYRIDRASFGASEAYSIFAATQDSLRAVIAASLSFDPGKPPLYQLLLHGYLNIFGASELSARSFSACFGLITTLLLYQLVATSVSDRVGLVAATLWSFNPYVVMIAQWARPYSLLAFTVVLSMYTLWRARRAATPVNLALLTLSLAACLYAHMAGVLCVAAAMLVIATDYFRERKNSIAAGAAVLASLVMFLPFLTTEARQAHSLLYGHWLDWAGFPHHVSAARILVVTVAAAATLGVALSPWSNRFRNGRAVQFYLIWTLIPALAITTISLALRPLWAIRYFVPSLLAGSALAAICLDRLRPWLRVAVCAIVVLGFVLGISIYEFGRREPWTLMTVLIRQEGGDTQPVFFEKGSIINAGGMGTDGFPEGYYRVPFDLYFKGGAPRMVVDSSDPEAARADIGAAALRFGGAWLISGKDDVTASNELPQRGFLIRRLMSDRQTTLYHVIPLNPDGDNR